MKQIYFYASKDDLLPVLEAVEGQGALKYILRGSFLARGLTVYARAAEIPNLGRASEETGLSCDSYLVCNASEPVNVRTRKTRDGVERYFVDQLMNPNTVEVTPAGLWGEDVVLTGRIATASNAPVAQKLMKHYGSAFRKQFVKVKAYFVGPQVLKLLAAGKRLTDAVQCPREFDLTQETASRSGSGQEQ